MKFHAVLLSIVFGVLAQLDNHVHAIRLPPHELDTIPTYLNQGNNVAKRGYGCPDVDQCNLYVCAQVICWLAGW